MKLLSTFVSCYRLFKGLLDRLRVLRCILSHVYTIDINVETNEEYLWCVRCGHRNRLVAGEAW